MARTMGSTDVTLPKSKKKSAQRSQKRTTILRDSLSPSQDRDNDRGDLTLHNEDLEDSQEEEAERVHRQTRTKKQKLGESGHELTVDERNSDKILALVEEQDRAEPPRSKITLGHFITELARSMRILNLEKTTMTSLPEELLDIACLHRMMEIETSENGEYQFVTIDGKEKKKEADDVPMTAAMGREILSRIQEVEGMANANLQILEELFDEVKKL